MKQKGTRGAAVNDPCENTLGDLRRRLPGPALCRRLGISRVTLWRWCRLRGFPAPARVGGLRLFDEEAAEAWLRDQVHR